MRKFQNLAMAIVVFAVVVSAVIVSNLHKVKGDGFVLDKVDRNTYQLVFNPEKADLDQMDVAIKSVMPD